MRRGMKEERKTELEGMLRAIQELKSEYYIGTQEAYDFLKEAQRIYSNPEKIADMMNQELARQGKVSYNATPARVACLEKILSGISFDLNMELAGSFENFVNQNLTSANDYLISLSPIFIPLEGSDAELNIYMVFDTEPEKMSRVLLPFFDRANKDSISCDADFGAETIELLKEEYEKIIPLIDNDKTDAPCDLYMSALFRELARVDWERELSRESFNEYVEICVHNAKSDISTSVMLDRLLRDKVDHKLEYRRAVLCKWLSDREIDSYELAIDISEKNLLMREEMLGKMQLSDAPERVIKRQESLVRSARFVRHLLGADKNFVKRYLEH